MHTCVECGRSFTDRSNKRRKCSTCRASVPCPSCGSRMDRRSQACDNCTDRSGAANGNWRGGKTKHHKGYVMRLDPRRGRYVFEHVLVMEESLGRELLPGENVHHRNGIRDDNRLENLELWTRPQPSGIRVEDAVAHAFEVLRTYAPEYLSEEGAATVSTLA